MQIRNGAFVAAGVSFSLSILRDYLLISGVQDSALFYTWLYIGSIAGGMAINVVMLAGHRLHFSELFFLYCAGLGVIIVLSSINLDSFIECLLLAIIFLLWLAGAYWSRISIEKGHMFLGRSRDAVTSLIICVFIIANQTYIGLIFLFAVIGGTIFSFFISRIPDECDLVNNPGRSTNTGASRSFSKYFFISLLFVNLSPIIMNTWALHYNAMDFNIYGYQSTALIRGAMILFQIISISCFSLVSHATALPEIQKPLRIILLLFALLSGVLFMPIELMIPLVPLTVGGLHFMLVLAVQNHRINKS